MLLRGSELSPSVRAEVLNAYVHRFTGDHKPDWAKRPMKDGKPYPVQFATDSEWLDKTFFHVRKDGGLDRRAGSCEASPTWPFNPELRK